MNKINVFIVTAQLSRNTEREMANSATNVIFAISILQEVTTQLLLNYGDPNIKANKLMSN
ncbi:MAG: hypothetical protein ACJAXI_000839 [Crocinitomicaceae bacterium]|jgi:hypothetical protein